MAKRSSSTLVNQWFSNPGKDLLSGLVVAFAMIPEAIAFSGIAGVDPKVGLFGAFCLSLTIAVVGGRMAMITSATGSTALLMTGLVASGEGIGPGLGVKYLLVAGLVTGVLQILWGYMRLADQMRFVPQGVLSGFVNALALLIFQAQLPQLGFGGGHGEGGDHAAGLLLPHGGQVQVVWALVVLGLVIIYGLPRLTRVVPSQLVAIVVLTAISIGFHFDIPMVSSLGNLPDGLPSLGIPFGQGNGGVPFNLETLMIILPYSAAVAAVGLLESLMTQNLVDDLTDTTSSKNQECIGQGLANFATGFIGGMAGCAMIGQSMINVKSGAVWLSKDI